MKVKLFITQLENEINLFPYLKVQTGCAADNGNLRKCTIKIKLLQESISKSLFVSFLKKKIALWHYKPILTQWIKDNKNTK